MIANLATPGDTGSLCHRCKTPDREVFLKVEEAIGGKLTPGKFLDIQRERSFRSGEWREEAACAETETELFFPPSSEYIHPLVKRLCQEDCPVRLYCLTYSLITRQRDGIWGGDTPKQRRKLWRSLLRALRQMQG